MHILFFGDSICEGSNPACGGLENSWPSLVAARLPQHHISNRSRGGRPTDSVAEFTDALREVSGADLLVLALGANDARDLTPGMTERACGNLRQMLQLGREAGIGRFLLVGPYNINPDALGPSWPIRHERQQNLEALNRAYQELAREEDAGFLTMYGLIPPSSLLADGVHPDKAGNLPLADAFCGYLREHPEYNGQPQRL